MSSVLIDRLSPEIAHCFCAGQWPIRLQAVRENERRAHFAELRSRHHDPGLSYRV